MGGPGSGRKKAAQTLEKEIEAAKADLHGQVVVNPPLEAPKEISLKSVKQPTGSQIQVQGEGEEVFYNDQREKYLSEFQFESASDMADLDALLMHELLDYRYTTQLASGRAYDGHILLHAEQEQFRQNKVQSAKVIGDLKRQLGVARASRDGSQGSVADYIKELQRRAREFGVHRNEQIYQALVLANEAISIIETFDRSNETEKRVVGIESEADIVQHLRENFIPGFKAVDDAFKQGQRSWVSTL